MQMTRRIVLNVEDTEAVRYAKSRTLQRAGFEVVEAGTGADALRLVEELEPPVVVLDVRLPDISGFEVCEAIKRTRPGILVLQVSASFVSSGDRVRGLDRGADAYLTQPLEPEELVAAVRALFRIREADDQLRSLNETLEQRVAERTRELAEANARLRQEIADRERAEAALIQAQKMDAIGQLTGGIAHDFNNLLAAIVGGLDLIRTRVSDARTQRLVENAMQAAQRGAKLTARLLAFSRSPMLTPRSVDCEQLINGMTDLMAQSLGTGVRVLVELAPGTGPVVADPNQLELALLNLAINSRDAMPDGGTIRISTEPLHLRTAEPDLEPGAYVRIAVSDNGAGMPPEVVARAFDPFFTTKPAGQGTGLGLSQVYGVARQLGGTARIQSLPGEGTRVEIILKRADEAPEAATGPAQRIAGEGGNETVLVVDDDEDVRQLLVAVLGDLGYAVIEAADAQTALGILGRSDPDIALIDYAMPDMSGAELAQRLQARRPALPVVFTSGYADLAALESAVKSAPLLRKPFRSNELAEIIRATLDGRDA